MRGGCTGRKRARDSGLRASGSCSAASTVSAGAGRATTGFRSLSASRFGSDTITNARYAGFTIRSEMLHGEGSRMEKKHFLMQRSRRAADNGGERGGMERPEHTRVLPLRCVIPGPLSRYVRFSAAADRPGPCHLSRSLPPHTRPPATAHEPIRNEPEAMYTGWSPGSCAQL